MIYVTDFEKIHILRIDEENNFEPMKENIILNYLDCGLFLGSDDGRILLSYKQNEKNFITYQKKFIHEFEVFMKHQDLEYAQCVCLESGDIVIANEGIVYLLDGNSYQ